MREIPFARPFIQGGEEEAVLRVLRSGWLTTGAETIAFEKEFASFLLDAPIHASEFKNRPDIARINAGVLEEGELACFAVNSATSGLHLALECCGVKSGDVVFVPSYTFTSSAAVVRHLGADPVFVDTAPGTFHMDPHDLERRIESVRATGRARAVMPVHYGGMPCDMGAIMGIARKYGLKVIEDAAHSFPSLIAVDREDGSVKSGVGEAVYAGTVGDAGVFSFYTTKTLCTGEGGMVVTKDKGIASKVSIMRSHGIDRSVWNRYTDVKASWYYEVVEAGYKYNLPDIMAALGRVQLTRAWELFKMRQDIAREYDRSFSGDPHFTLPPSSVSDSKHLYPLRLNPETLSIARNEFIEKLKEGGVGVSVHFIPLHIMPYYKNLYHLPENELRETVKTYSREISLPIWPGMDSGQIGQVIEVVKKTAAQYTK
jgi:dTDP-4-amino-4,6-dideoxygalactose transaminase